MNWPMRAQSLLILNAVVIFCSGGAALGCSAAGTSAGDGDGDVNSTGGQVGAGTGGTGTGAAGSGGAGSGGDLASGGSNTGGDASSGGGDGTGGGAMVDCSSLPICEDFDAGAVGSVPTGFTAQLDYGNNGPAENVAISSETAHSGTQSVKVIGTTGLFGLKFETGSESYYLRTWLKIEGLDTGNPVIVGMGGDPNSEIRMRTFKSNSSPHYVVANAASGDGLSPPESSGSAACPQCVAVPSEWFCLRMRVDKATETLQMWVGDQQAVDLQNNSPWHSSGIWPASVSPVRIGGLALQGGGATVFIDDLAVGSDPIACQ